MANLGDKRTFTFSKNEYEIKEILENPNITMWWSYSQGLCPHCKKEIEKRILYDFITIEILIKVGVETATFEDVLCLGFTSDKRQILLDKEATLKTLDKSTQFKYLSEVL